jgi:hypothetical protein
MPFDLEEQAVRHLGTLPELFQDCKFQLQFLIGAVHGSNKIGHVSNGERVKTNPKDHPRNGKNAFIYCAGRNITKSNGCKSLEGPVETT